MCCNMAPQQVTKPPKRPRDFSQAAKLVVDIASGQVEDRKPGANQINPERTGLRLGTERHWSALVERQRLFGDPAPPAFALVRGFGGDGARRRCAPNGGSRQCHRKNCQRISSPMPSL